ncbi:uncharacterized protein ZBAI_01354 [Zygosaccharomyces bailii ISA1307]|nr:uncharacterized protein ZBAI_01354 [Zygosaccharomyces bailii ISA1307]
MMLQASDGPVSSALSQLTVGCATAQRDLTPPDIIAKQLSSYYLMFPPPQQRLQSAPEKLAVDPPLPASRLKNTNHTTKSMPKLRKNMPSCHICIALRRRYQRGP